MYECLLSIFTIFLFNRTDVFTHNQRQDGVRKCQCCFEETCPGITTIFQTVQRYALTLVRCQSVDYESLWTAGSGGAQIVNQLQQYLYGLESILLQSEEKIWHYLP